MKLAFDFTSARRADANGFLHVARCNLTKAGVNDYYGREIPGCDRLGLDPDAVYGVLRPPEELERAAAGLNGLPILDEHVMDHDAARPFKDKRIGAVGTAGEWSDPYLVNDIVLWDEASIREVESGRRRELSCGYAYEPLLESGEFAGKPYRVRMTDIAFNHVALVAEGRAGPDVKVADSRSIPSKGESVSDNDSETDPGVIERLRALAGELADGETTDEDKDRLAAVLDLLDALEAGDDDEDDDEEEEEAGDEAPDDDDAEPVPALDAESIKADIRREFRLKELAILDVELLIGSAAKAMALDSAEEVYRHALRLHGIEADDAVGLSGLKIAVSVLKKSLSAPASARALDARPTGDDARVLDAIAKSPYGRQLEA